MGKSKRTNDTLSFGEKGNVFLHYLDLSWQLKQNEEQQSDQRIKSFLTIATIMAGVIGYFLKEKLDSGMLFWITLISMVVLFVFGMVTFARIIWRGRTIDYLDKLGKNASSALKELDSSFKNILTAEQPDEPQNNLLRKIKGTQAQFLYIAQGLLAAGISTAVFLRIECSPFFVVVVGVLLALAVTRLMFIWSQYVRHGKSISFWRFRLTSRSS